MALDEKGCVLEDRAVEGVLVVLVGVELEVGEGGRSVRPVDEVHDVAEAAHHAACAHGHLGGALVHEVVGARAALGGNALLLLAERVTEPAHDQAGLEGEGLVLPHARNGVAIHAHAAVVVGLGARGVEFVLPEAAPKDARLSRQTCVDANHAQLAVAAAHHDGRPLSKSGVARALGAHMASQRAALEHWLEEVRAKAAALGDRGVPVALLKAHDAGG